MRKNEKMKPILASQIILTILIFFAGSITSNPRTIPVKNYKLINTQPLIKELVSGQDSTQYLALFHVFNNPKNLKLLKINQITLVIKHKFKKLKLVQIDCNQFSIYCKRLNIPKYPSLMLISNGKTLIFQEKLHKKLLFKWLKANVGQEVKTLENLEALVEKRKNLKASEAMLLYFNDSKVSQDNDSKKIGYRTALIHKFAKHHRYIQIY